LKVSILTAVLFTLTFCFVNAFAQLDPNKTYDNIIPPFNYTAKGFPEVGVQYPPVSTALKCMLYFNQPRNETARTYGQYVADWFALRGNRTNDYIVFAHDFPWPQYNLTKGWKSGLAQAHVAECFMEAYQHTEDRKYLDLAKKALMFLNVSTSEGGVKINEGVNRSWYEEYPTEGGSYVLNGHQFVLIALSKYLDIEDDPDIFLLFRDGLNALKANALQYDYGYNYSYYDRLWHPAKKYHKTHIINFERLYNITGNPDWLLIKQMFEK
jgi:hypothetical protein